MAVYINKGNQKIKAGKQELASYAANLRESKEDNQYYE
jgi:hypothetical protein